MSTARPPSKPLRAWLARAVAFATAAAITLGSLPVRAQTEIAIIRQTVIATNNAKMADAAISLLRAALIKEPKSADAYIQLAMAYGRKIDYANADLASAQAAFAGGDNKTARELAARAKERFPIGSPLAILP
jgi:predicted Zn-dependent protease